jgi:hypothetical protein
MSSKPTGFMYNIPIKYIYICVCVCACACALAYKQQVSLFPMSSSSNGTYTPCKSKVESMVVGQDPLGHWVHVFTN